MGAPVIQPSAGDTLVLTAVAASIQWGATAGQVQGSAVYTGTITGGASNGLANQAFTIAGFVNKQNNGSFVCLSSTATTITLANAFAVAETHAATAAYSTQGFPTQYASKIEKMMTTNQGDNVYTYVRAGDTLLAIAVGLKSLWPFDQLHGSSPSFGYLQGLNDFNANPVISDGSANVWTLAANIDLVDADYTPGATPPVAPNPWPSCVWSVDGYYPSVYVWVCDSANAGPYDVNLNSVYQDGIIAPGDLAAGKPIFDGGINFQIARFTGMTAPTADGSSTGVSAANPAVAPAFVTTGTGDLVIVVGLQKSANALNLGTDATLTAPGYQRLSSGKLVGSEAHYVVEWGIQTAAGSWTPQFANPLGYETVLVAVAIKHT